MQDGGDPPRLHAVALRHLARFRFGQLFSWKLGQAWWNEVTIYVSLVAVDAEKAKLFIRPGQT